SALRPTHGQRRGSGPDTSVVGHGGSPGRGGRRAGHRGLVRAGESREGEYRRHVTGGPDPACRTAPAAQLFGWFPLGGTSLVMASTTTSNAVAPGSIRAKCPTPSNSARRQSSPACTAADR